VKERGTPRSKRKAGCYEYRCNAAARGDAEADVSAAAPTTAATLTCGLFATLRMRSGIKSYRSTKTTHISSRGASGAQSVQSF